MARGLKFQTWLVEGLYYPYSENKGADQLRSYFFVFAYVKSRFSHNEAHINDDTGLTVTYFTARSNLVVYVFEQLLQTNSIWKKTLQQMTIFRILCL